MTSFRLFWIKRLCRQQFQIWRKWQTVIQTSRKHCGKRRNCSSRAISPFPTVFSKGLFPMGIKGVIMWEWVKCMYLCMSVWTVYIYALSPQEYSCTWKCILCNKLHTCIESADCTVIYTLHNFVTYFGHKVLPNMPEFETPLIKKPLKNMVGKGENFGNQHFLLLPCSNLLK